MIDMILQQAEGLNLCERRRLIEMLKASVLAELAGPDGDPSECPRCHHAHVVRKGIDADGSQQWLCNGCGRHGPSLVLETPSKQCRQRFEGLGYKVPAKVDVTTYRKDVLGLRS